MCALKKQLQWLAEAGKSAEYAEVHARMDFAVDFERRMEQAGVTSAELAKRLGSNVKAIDMVLRGEVDLPISSMVRMAQALDAKVQVHLAATTRAA